MGTVFWYIIVEHLLGKLKFMSISWYFILMLNLKLAILFKQFQLTFISINMFDINLFPNNLVIINNNSDNILFTFCTMVSSRQNFLGVKIVFRTSSANGLLFWLGEVVQRPYNDGLILYKSWRPNHHKCFSWLSLFHLNTYVMGLQPL